MSTEYHVGQRLSLRGNCLTVRYIGPVESKPGQWLGVEWDDPSRGFAVDTVADGVLIIKGKNPHKTSASFIKPSAAWDETYTATEAVRSKYGAEQILDVDSVRISGKTVEEKGYDKIAQQLRRFGNIKILNLSGQRVATAKHQPPGDSVNALCPAVRDLDLGWNLLESLADLESVLADSEHIAHLSLCGNQLHSYQTGATFETITSLDLDSMLLTAEELQATMKAFPSLTTLSASSNLLDGPSMVPLTSNLTSIDLHHNRFCNIGQVAQLVLHCPSLTRLGLKGNMISALNDPTHEASLPKLGPRLCEVDLSLNEISSWTFVDGLNDMLPALKHLRLSQNPIYAAVSASVGRRLNEAETSMVIAARLPNLQSLNFSSISEKDRTNAESFYLSIITQQLSGAHLTEEDAILRSHPRYSQLCHDYGKPVILRKSEQKGEPNSIAARLLTFAVHQAAVVSSERAFSIPATFSLYNLYSHVARLHGQAALTFTLTWETGEGAPRGRGIDVHQSVEDWNSDDEETTIGWGEREELLVPGTRPLATIFEGGGTVRLRLDSR